MTKTLAALGLLLAASGSLSSASAQAADGHALYDANCKKCHGVAGVPSAGIKKMSPKIETLDAAFFAKRTDADLVKQISEGKDKLTPDEIAAVAKYMRTLGK